MCKLASFDVLEDIKVYEFIAIYTLIQAILKGQLHSDI